MNELNAVFLFLAMVSGFLAWFWFSPTGVLKLRHLAEGQIQVDVRPGYRPATLYQLLEMYGPQGREWFRRMLFVDMVFPAVYAAGFWLLSDVLLTRQAIISSAGHIAALSGVMAAGFDYLENILLLKVLKGLPQQKITLARLAGFCTSFKTAGLLCAIITIVFGLLLKNI